MSGGPEETLLLRLPPALAARVGVSLDASKLPQAPRKRGDAHQQASRAPRRSLPALLDSVWGDEGVPDYDSADETADLLMAVHEDAAPESESMGGGPEAGASLAISYYKVQDRDFFFVIEDEEYYATLVSLPCVTEVQKTNDEKSFYTTGNVGQMLLVHDVKVGSGPRPAVPTEWPDGITPPMRDVVKQRFEPTSSEARREALGLSLEDVKAGDQQLAEMQKLVQQRQTMRRAAANKVDQKKPGGNKISSTVFVHEEIIDSEPWMDQHPDEVIVVEPRNDSFVSSTEEAIRAALDVASADEERRRIHLDKHGRSLGSIPGATTTTSTFPASRPPLASSALPRSGSMAPPTQPKPAGAPPRAPVVPMSSASSIGRPSQPKQRPPVVRSPPLSPSLSPTALSPSLSPEPTPMPVEASSQIPEQSPTPEEAPASYVSPAPTSTPVVDPEIAALQVELTTLEDKMAREKNLILKKKLERAVVALKEKIAAKQQEQQQ